MTTNNNDIKLMVASSLAFVGDAVFSLFVRQKLALTVDKKSSGLHKLASAFVNAKAQATMADVLYLQLTQEEQDIFDRCKNAHVDNKTKAASYKEYKKATGLEGVLGYLYLCEDEQRLQELCNLCYEIVSVSAR